VNVLSVQVTCSWEGTACQWSSYRTPGLFSRTFVLICVTTVVILCTCTYQEEYVFDLIFALQNFPMFILLFA